MPNNGASLVRNLMKNKLNPVQLAKLAAGVPLATILAEVPATPDAPATPAAAAPDVAPAADVDPKVEATEPTLEVDTDPAASASPAAPAAAAPAPDQTALVAFLQTEMRTAQASLAEAQFKLREAQAKLDEQSATHSAFAEIARASLSTMQVALNAPVSAAALGSADLLAEHKRIQAVFTDKFAVGGVAATNPSDGKPKAALVNPLFASMLPKAQASK